MATAVQKITLSSSRDIPFNKLVLSQSNVRRVKAGISVEELAESIARRGLIQSLHVRPVVDAEGKETGMFEVPAGGRRFRALELLVKQKRLADAAGAALGAITVILNKPVSYVSAQPEPGQTPAARLLTRQNLFGGQGDIPPRDASLPPVGRLDMDSRGLLILSTDGVVAKAVIGPQSDLEKEYLVRVTGEITEARMARLRHGLHLDGKALKPAKITPAGDQPRAPHRE